MRVVVHTPRIFVETYDVPDTLAQGHDSALLSYLASGGPGIKRVGAEMVNTGLPRIHFRSGTDVAELGARLSDAKAAVDRLMDEAVEHVRPMIEAGELSERGVASDLGVTRNTLRAWLGKPRAS